MRKFFMVLLMLAVLLGGIEIATLAEQKRALQGALEEQVQMMVKKQEDWEKERLAGEEERMELLRKARLTQLENDALHMENENLLALLQDETMQETPSPALFQPNTEKVQIE